VGGRAISRVLFARRDGQMIISLGWLSPATSRGLPAAQATRAGSRCLLGLAPTGGYRAAPVTRRAVGSYPTVSPLPLDKGRSVFCGPFRRLTAPRRYLAVCPVELGLSSARHWYRPAAIITPYHHPVESYRLWKGRGKPSAPGAVTAAPRCPLTAAGRDLHWGLPRAPARNHRSPRIRHAAR
jgi:hypothetical protein